MVGSNNYSGIIDGMMLQNNADFENPICFDVKEAAPNEQNHLLCNQTTQFDSQITR